MSTGSSAAFLSYASEDAQAAARICEALRAAGIEVWFDQSELRGGDAWDASIRKQIKNCGLFIPIVSANAHARVEGYFRLEWKLAVDRSHLISSDQAFLLPVVIDDTRDDDERIPERFRELQWTRLPDGATPAAFCERVKVLLGGVGPAARPRSSVGLEPIALPKRTSHRWQIIAAATALMAAVIGWQAWRVMQPKPSSGGPPTAVATVPDKSIAVLPFVDMSEKKDQEYFADGMAEEIIERLVKVSTLHIPARASSFYFKGKSTTVAEIAHELGVANILEGSVRKSGNHLRIGVQLVRADSGFSLWSESYDRDLEDVFKVQDEVATAVAAALQISLSGGSLTRELGGTRNLRAYDLYLRAQNAIGNNTATALKASRDYLEQAVKLDPNFGLAWNNLAEAWEVMADRVDVPPGEGYGRARQLARHALEVSPGLAEPHAILAYLYRTYDWDWAASAAELHRAVSINPRAANALMYTGLLAMTQGHWDEAERQMRASAVLNPLSSYAHFNLGNTLYLSGHYAEAEVEFRKVLEIAPDFEWTRSYLAKALLAEGKPQAALQFLQQMESGINKIDYLPICLLANGRSKAESDTALRQLESQYAATAAYYVAINYAYRNEKELALQWLERAYEQKDPGLIEIVGEPLLKNLYGDPRYNAFLRKMNLPET